jgi:hypothetical protein
MVTLDIEDLNLNLTGTMSTPDESNSEDDELTRDLKRDHRTAKRNLYDISAEYKVAKTRSVLEQPLFFFFFFF